MCQCVLITDTLQAYQVRVHYSRRPEGACWRPRAAGSYLYASHHLSGLTLIKARGLGDVSHEIIHPLPSPPLTHPGYSVSPHGPLIALFFTPQSSSALSFIHFSLCWRSLTHISIISISFLFRIFFPLNIYCCRVFLVAVRWLWERGLGGTEGGWRTLCQGRLLFNA